MLGAIIGDVAGSYLEVLEIEKLIKKQKRSYEDRTKILDNSIPLFNENCSVTDDSILTVAIADAILNNISYEEKLKEYSKREIYFGLDKYGRNRFSKGFIEWTLGNKQGNSTGNGCAMRISPIGFLFDDIEKVKEEAYKATIPSHNNQDSIKCAEVVAISIFLLRNGMEKYDLKKYIEKNYFNLNFDLDDLRHNYKFSSRAIDSVPHAIFCFLESKSFIDAIKISLSIGGDSDTIACICGALSESYYGIPENLIDEVKPYIKDYMFDIINQFYIKLNNEKVLILRK